MLDPNVAKFLDSLKKQGLNEQQIQTLAKQQKNPALWQNTHRQMLEQNKPPVPISNAPRSPVTGAQLGVSKWGKPKTGPLNPEQAQQLISSNKSLYDQIRQEAIKRYGHAPEYTTVGLTNKVVNEGASLNDVLDILRQGYGYESNPDLIRAADQVGLEYDSAESALKRRADEARARHERALAVANNYRTAHDQSLQSIYNDLQKELSGLQQQSAASYDATAQGIQQAYAGAQAGVADAFGDTQTGLAEQAARLGLGEALSDPVAELNEMLGQQLGYIGQSQGSDVASMLGLKGMDQGYFLKSQGIQRQELAQKRANLVNQVLSQIGNLNMEHQFDMQDIEGELSDLGRDRGAALREALNSVIEARTDRERQERLDALEAEIARGTLGIQQGELDLQRQEMLATLRLREQELAMQAAQFGQEHSLDRARVELERQRVANEIRALEQEAAQQMRISAPTTGYQAVEAFFNTPNEFWGQEAGPIFRGTFQSIISQAFNQAATHPDRGLDPRGIAHTLVNQDQYKSQNSALLRQAIDIFFGANNVESVYG